MYTNEFSQLYNICAKSIAIHVAKARKAGSGFKKRPRKRDGEKLGCYSIIRCFFEVYFCADAFRHDRF